MQETANLTPPTRATSDPQSAEPLRAEFLGLERLESHAQALAREGQDAVPSAGTPLLDRLLQNDRGLVQAHQVLSAWAQKQEKIDGETEWLLDNFHIISDALREIRADLPGNYYRQLPKLRSGGLAGLPRVYCLALELVTHSDSLLDEAHVTHFIQAYQTVTPLTIGELWAVPTMLRWVLVENLRRLADNALQAHAARERGREWAANLLAHEPTAREGETPRPPFANQAIGAWPDAFTTQVHQELRDHGATAQEEALEQALTNAGAPIGDILRRERRLRAANQVSIGNCVTSLRLISALDWTAFFERTSAVEALLRQDPAGVYANQDFATRDRYRQVVEKLARGTGLGEVDVVARVLSAARAVGGNGEQSQAGAEPFARLRQMSPKKHVGYYLVGSGRAELAETLQYRPTLPDRCRELVLRHAHALYFGGIALLTVMLSLGLLAYFHTAGVLLLLVIALVALVPLSELAVGLMNALATHAVRPRVLPKFSFEKGLPPSCAAFVVIPCLLARRENVANLLEKLEIHYLSNPDPQLRFALLSDFADAPSEHMPEDEELVAAASAGIKGLNQRYASPGAELFFLCHRRRQWNAAQNCWMGWERKRGKLLEFNRLLRGNPSTSFTQVSGDVSGLTHIRYVITLDADTQLPRETARRLIATLAHPLNQPRLDAEGKLTSGYAILQPRIAMSLAGANKSWFAHLFSQSAGVDPYATAVSDVYQDLFGEGSFTGKGIYEIDAFQAGLDNLFPENAILSHDLIEGNHARCGLVSDIELIDQFPSHYRSYALREHRWVRGDWQIAPWLFPSVPGPDGKARPNALGAVQRWKILDNLRRSMLPPALLALLILGWTVLPGPAWVWTALVVLVMASPLLPGLLAAPSALVRGQRVERSLLATAGQTLLAIIFLPSQAWLMADAIARTLTRVLITRKRLLEWETSAATEHRLGKGWLQSWRDMGPAPALATLMALALFFFRPDLLTVAGPFLLGWWLAPSIAYWVSRTWPVEAPALSEQENQRLRCLARKTWSFFETYVGEEDHWLPPDNYQEDPKNQVAHRTSPTNIGLYLQSTLAAHDFGFLSLGALIERLEKAFAALDRLERVNGHFLNWYDTQTLQPLQPRYISTVDSGNFLACLLALKHALSEKLVEAYPEPNFLEGLRCTLHLAGQAYHEVEPPVHPLVTTVMPRIENLLDKLETELGEMPADFLARKAWLERMDQNVLDLLSHARAFAALIHETPQELLDWVQALHRQVRDRVRELNERVPWAALLREAPDGLRAQAVGRALCESVSLAELAEGETAAPLRLQLAELGKNLAAPAEQAWLNSVIAALDGSAAKALLKRCHGLAERAAAWADAMNFKMLFNEPRLLFSVGYNLSNGRLDPAHYDLLASEASLTSFLAIARGDVPQKHWFQLGRPLARVAGEVVLMSWGGTMFEYLMPRLFLRGLPGTQLFESQHAAVERQIAYGRHCSVPWGISESAFSVVDGDLNYQYQAFGVPGLGLKRGLGNDLVVAPYATFLAVGHFPHRAVRNLDYLAREGGESTHGFYEALDYTRDRLQPRQRCAIVKCYMAHHQGMALLALANYLLKDPVVRRLRAEPMVRATELLLEERVPVEAPASAVPSEPVGPPRATVESPVFMCRRLNTPDTAHPRTHMLSNGQYSVMVTNAGSSYSTCRGLDVTRWREERTGDHYGQFCYLRDETSGQTWAAGHQPLCVPADDYEVVYATDKAEFHRLDGVLATRLEVTVTPEHQAEIRRLIITNHDSVEHVVELTSYAEIVLLPHDADRAHPAFGKLFVETECIAAEEALLCKRRPRTGEQKPIWAVHVVACGEPNASTLQFETDRARFLGRGRTPANPAALDPNTVLSGTVGPVLDPIFSLRKKVRIAANASASIAFTTAVAETRDEALALADQYHEFHTITRAFELAWAHSQVELRHLHLSAEEAHLYQRLAAHIWFAGPRLRAPASVIAANRQGQTALWHHGISGDKPIVLAHIEKTSDIALIRQLLAAHVYWRQKGLQADLVILNEQEAGYFEDLQQELRNLVRAGEDRGLLDQPGGVFLLKASHMSHEDQVLLQAVARCVLVAGRGTLAGQLERLDRYPSPRDSAPIRGLGESAEDATTPVAAPARLLFHNGLGGFTPDGREYVLLLPALKKTQRFRPWYMTGRTDPAAPAPSRLPPAPWVNVIANARFGFLVSESGAGCTWAGNSQMNRLTPWRNDPVSDPPGEIIYLRDEVTGESWSPTFLPAPGALPCLVRHGQGYTVFEQNSHGLRHELLLLVPTNDPIKLMSLKVKNLGRKPRTLSATFFAEWVLGSVREQSAMHVITAIDGFSGALLARNPYQAKGATHIAFADISLRPRTFTADRTEFLGRNGSVAWPRALAQSQLKGKTGASLDPCAALQGRFELKPDEEKEIVFLLGQADTIEEVQRLLNKYRRPGAAAAALKEVTGFWDRILNTVQVSTPDPSMDVMLNRWLLYQVLSCRVWGRTAFYQSSGAFGFRDQLQDVMALVHTAPHITREHILRCAGRQFLEGDVQHWWHEPDGAGVRSRCCDDFLWLPFVVMYYLAHTGDRAILDEQRPFLQAPLLRPDQDEDYRVPGVSKETASLYEHCARAVQHGCRFGTHGLPLMGTGDWNDGMNFVGRHGKGESVWAAWFLYMILRDFAPLAEQHGDTQRVELFTQSAAKLQVALKEHAWDGAWYRRAYFDDGTPLGSAQNDECRIDSLPQTWAVISGAGDPERARQAMQSVMEHLLRSDEKLITLFTPPFDKGPLEPGYIKGYLPGIRENGGQYTHGATWVAQAYALLGQGTQAGKMFTWLNPITHSATARDMAQYQAEPYVVAGDVYSQPPHAGRAGWSWYSGAAGWLYRVGLESILGLSIHHDRLTFNPSIPARWPSFQIRYRFKSTTYRITIDNPDGVEHGVQTVTLDGVAQKEPTVPLADDGKEHEVRVVLGNVRKDASS